MQFQQKNKSMRPLNRGQISYCTRVLMQKVTHRAAKTILDKILVKNILIVT